MRWPMFTRSSFRRRVRSSRESVTQSCPCGTPPSLAWLPYMDQAVTADPVGAVQVRRRIKMYKALLGPEAAVYGDHVELSAMTASGNDWIEHGDDFASTIGTGGVVGTKFVWPELGPKFKARQSDRAEGRALEEVDCDLQREDAFEGNLPSISTPTATIFLRPTPSRKTARCTTRSSRRPSAAWGGEVELRGLAPEPIACWIMRITRNSARSK